MNSTFLNSLQKTSNYTETENSAVAHATTNSTLLDYFSQGGALRFLKEEDQELIFLRAWNEAPLLALKAMFYFRDVRGGQGQRDAFRNQLRMLAELNPDVVLKNLDKIPFFGRWDDLYALDGTKIEDSVYALIAAQLEHDMQMKENVSLLAKWLKSENASSAETKRLGTKTRRKLNMSSKEYRQLLSKPHASQHILLQVSLFFFLSLLLLL